MESAGQGVGGIMGRINSGKAYITDCLVTGKVQGNYSNTGDMFVGGILGGDNKGNWTLTRCLMAGEMNAADAETTGVAPLVGSVVAGSSAKTRVLEDCYTTTTGYGDVFVDEPNGLADNNKVSGSESCSVVDTASKENVPNLFKSFLWTTAEDGSAILQCGGQRTLKAIYDADMNYESGQGGLAIYVPTEKGYINYNFVHSVNTNKNADMWRLSNTFLCGNDGKAIKQITYNAEWEMAIMLEDMHMVMNIIQA